jgi:hypothetical protein
MSWGGSRDGAGRPKKGQPTSRQAKTRAIKEMMDKHNYSPIESMIAIAKDKKQDIVLRVSCHKELARYVAPQLKAVEIEQSGDRGITIELVQFSPDKDVVAKVKEEEERKAH